LKTENLSTLKIHKLTQEQYDRELAAGRLDENALYLTPNEEINLNPYITKDEVTSVYETKSDASDKLIEAKAYTDEAIENVKTDIANQDAVVLSSAQAYINEVAATKVNKISDASTSITVTVADNTEYRFPNATTVNITCPNGEYECWIKLGTAAKTVSISNAVCMTSCSLTPEDLTSGGGYIEISIKDGIYIIQKAG
jgi:hypothetical protein